VPRISYFFGIAIYMHFRDHAPPHFHARYAEHRAQIAIGTLETIQGSLPRRALKLVREWASLHLAELAENWELARDELTLRQIPPLE
jgi:hypothetical protein